MNRCARRGSILLYCLAIVSALAVLAYGFVRVAQLSRVSGDGTNMQLLAREAAVTGVNHAMEQLLRDFAREPQTQGDNPGMAAFAAHDGPWGYDTAVSPALDLARTTGGAQAINHSDMPATTGFQILQYGLFFDGVMERPLKEGYLAQPGRGRFYEPEFYNLPPAAPASYAPAVAQPVVPVRFGATAASLPERSAGIFYDERLRPIAGDPLAARERARYRLRYAISTIDLEGQLLVNGDQGVAYSRIDGADPRTEADPYVARIKRNMHRLPAIVDAHEIFSHGEVNVPFMRGGAAAGAGAEHVFIGRGSTGNLDSPRANNFAPSTFPLMYRGQANQPTRFGMGGNAPDGNWPGATLFTSSVSPGVAGLAAGGEASPTAGAGNPFLRILVGPQFTFSNWLHATYGNATEGGLHERGLSPMDRYSPFGRGISRVDPGEPVSRYRGYVDTPWCVNLLTVTPRLTYAMVAGYMPPGGICLRYGNRANPPTGYRLSGAHAAGATTITLVPGTGAILVNDIVVVGSFQYTVTAVSGVVLTIGAPGLLASDAASTPVTIITPGRYAATRTRDLFVDALSPAFSRYAAPTRLASGPNPAIQPDYHVDDFWRTTPGTERAPYRGPRDRYPGEMAFNGFDPAAVHAPGNPTDMIDKWRNDALGYYLRSRRSAAVPLYTPTARWAAAKVRPAAQNETPSHAPAWPFWVSQGNTRAAHLNDAASVGITVPDTLTPVSGTSTSQVGPHPDSIWEVIGQAMAATASTVQGQRMLYANAASGGGISRYPNRWFDNDTWDAAGTGPRAATIADVDRLFVANLGSSFDAPNDPTPVKAWYGTSAVQNGLVSFTPDWNLAALNDLNPRCLALTPNPGRMPAASAIPNLPIFALNHPSEPGYDAAAPTYSATERTQVVELIVNDFRMSFFGASPQYRDGFRALDLNGDGKAACSAYPANPTATANETARGIDQYSTAIDAAGVALAHPPFDRYFSSTGTFILGKSRFWRILVRGEVWDNLTKVTVNRAQLDTVLCIDPVEAAHEIDPALPQDPQGGQYSTHIISQSWVLDGSREFLPRRN